MGDKKLEPYSKLKKEQEEFVERYFKDIDKKDFEYLLSLGGLGIKDRTIYLEKKNQGPLYSRVS